MALRYIEATLTIGESPMRVAFLEVEPHGFHEIQPLEFDDASELRAPAARYIRRVRRNRREHRGGVIGVAERHLYYMRVAGDLVDVREVEMTKAREEQ